MLDTDEASICHIIVFKSRDANNGAGAQTVWHIDPSYVYGHTEPEAFGEFTSEIIVDVPRREKTIRTNLRDGKDLGGAITRAIHPRRVIELITKDLIAKGALSGRIEAMMVPGTDVRNNPQARDAFENMHGFLLEMKDNRVIRNVRTKGLRLQQGQMDWTRAGEGSSKVVSKPGSRTVWREK